MSLCNTFLVLVFFLLVSSMFTLDGLNSIIFMVLTLEDYKYMESKFG